MKRVIESQRIHTAQDLERFLQAFAYLPTPADKYVEVAGKRVVGAEVIEDTLSDKSLVYDIRLLTER